MLKVLLGKYNNIVNVYPEKVYFKKRSNEDLNRDEYYFMLTKHNTDPILNDKLLSFFCSRNIPISTGIIIDNENIFNNYSDDDDV